jgi:hypothetical protein
MAEKTQAKEIILSDGRKAVIKDGKGRDLFEAMRLASEPGEISKMLLVRLVEIDGKPITEDDIDELPLTDAVKLLDAMSDLLPFTRTQK